MRISKGDFKVMRYRDFEFYLSEKDNVWQYNSETGKEECFSGLCCEIYRAIDEDMKNPLCVFDLAKDVDIPGLDENAAIEIVMDRIDKEYERLMEEAAFSMDRFIKINGAVFSFEEVAKALGVECDPGREPVQLHLCQRVDDGVLVAKGAFFDKDEYPAIDLELQLPAEKDSLPVMISRTEQPRVEGAYSDGYRGVRTFGYSRADEYFMYFDSDTRPDALVDKDYNQKGLNPKVVVSGGYNYTPEVYQSNQYVKFMGDLPVEEQTREPDVKLEVGMVGRLKDEEGIKKALRGKAVELVEVGDKGFANCKIEGQRGTFTVHVSQLEDVKKVEPVLGDLFASKEVDGHVLAGLDKDTLLKALKDAPVGTVITGVRDASGRYDFDTHIEKHGGYVRNYFAPVKTSDYDTWWTVGGEKRHEYDLADILQGKSKYYFLTEQKDGVSMDEKDNSVRELAGRLVDFMKEYDFYEFLDSLDAGGEEEAIEKIAKELTSIDHVNWYVKFFEEMSYGDELTYDMKIRSLELMEAIGDWGNRLVSGQSLDFKIKNAKGQLHNEVKSPSQDKGEVGLEL